MHHFKVLVFLLYIFANGLCQDPRYCNLHPQHTLCINPKIGPYCKDFKEVKPTSDQINEIVDWHNEIRQSIALGTGTTLPAAANMMKMEWDPELAEMAQRTANQCLHELDCHKCMRVLGGRFRVGQGMANRLQYNRGIFDFIELINLDFEDVQDYFSSRFLNSFYSTDVLDNYSKHIWWNTRAVGCGGSSYLSFQFEGLYDDLVVCNYGPAGNIEGAKIYSPGEKCTRCPSGTVCDETYDGLCAINGTNFDVRNTFPTDRIYLGLNEIIEL